jgi:hypothetical protein
MRARAGIQETKKILDSLPVSARMTGKILFGQMKIPMEKGLGESTDESSFLA